MLAGEGDGILLIFNILIACTVRFIKPYRDPNALDFGKVL